MKQKAFRFFKTYRFCFLLCGIIEAVVFGVFACLKYLLANGNHSTKGYALCLILIGVPLCSILYGFATYIKVKKVWIPLLIYFSVSFVLYFFFFFGPGMTLPMTTIYSLCSLIGTGLAAFVAWFCQAWKEAWKDDPKVEPIDETD